MMILPSVGSTVTRVLLNKSATKAQVTFDDGCVCIIATETCTNNGATPVLKKKKKVLHSESVKQDPVIKKKIAGMKKRVTESGMPAPMAHSKDQLEVARIKALQRAQNRAERLAEQAMTPSERVGLSQVAEAEKKGLLV